MAMPADFFDDILQVFVLRLKLTDTRCSIVKSLLGCIILQSDLVLTDYSCCDLVCLRPMQSFRDVALEIYRGRPIFRAAALIGLG